VPQARILVTSGKSLALLRASPARHEGRFAIVTNVGWKMRWTPVARETNARSGGRRSRGVLISRRWYQLGNNARALRRGWWQESPITRETTKETVKTIRAGNAGMLPANLR
jgi:hypothetical protein